MQFDLFPSRIGQKKNFFVYTARSMSGSHTTVSTLSYRNSTTRHPRLSKHLSPRSKLASGTLPWISIAQTLPNMPYAHGRITFLPGGQDYQNHSPLPTGVASQHNTMLHSTCYVHVVKSSPLGTQSAREVVLF